MVQKRALIIGIDEYDNVNNLTGAVNDANKIAHALSENYDESPNFDCRVITNPGNNPPITRAFLRENWQDLFDNFDGEVIFYFSGHGTPTMVGGFLVTTDAVTNDPGLPMSELLELANQSNAKSILLILDCCYSGSLGNINLLEGTVDNQALLHEGVTILTASRPKQPSKEVGGHGVFTELVIGALTGGAADVRGRVSAASIYAYVEAALGSWEQRPMYKSHASHLSPVRLCTPSIPDSLLRELPKIFENSDSEHRLDQTYEQSNKYVAKPDNVELFTKFKKLQVARLLQNRSGDDLYWTAEHSGSVFLTPLGQFYWKLAKNRRI